MIYFITVSIVHCLEQRSSSDYKSFPIMGGKEDNLTKPADTDAIHVLL